MTGIRRLPSLGELAAGCAQSAQEYKQWRAENERPAWPPNPFPKGAKPGSATSAALAALEAAYPRWLEAWELMRITGRSRGAVAWGMQYLARQGLIKSIQSSRHPQYLRYRIIKKEVPYADQTARNGD